MSTKALALVVIVMGAVPVALGVVPALNYAPYAQRGVRAEAIVVDAERLWLRELLYPIRKRDIYRLTYEFRVAGAPARSTGIYMQSRVFTAPTTGQKLVVYYLPEDPGASYLTDRDTLFDAALFAGFGFLLWGGGGWYAWRRRKRISPPG